MKGICLYGRNPIPNSETFTNFFTMAEFNDYQLLDLDQTINDPSVFKDPAAVEPDEDVEMDTSGFNYETLSEHVRKHPVIYDKKAKGYRDKDCKANTWKDIARELGITAQVAQAKWENLKKRLSAKRAEIYKKSKSGASSRQIAASHRKLEKDKVFYWILDTMPQRPNSKSKSTPETRSVVGNQASSSSQPVASSSQITPDQPASQMITPDQPASQMITPSQPASQMITPSQPASQMFTPERTPDASFNGRSGKKSDPFLARVDKVLEMLSAQPAQPAMDDTGRFAAFIADKMRRLPQHLNLELQASITQQVLQAESNALREGTLAVDPPVPVPFQQSATPQQPQLADLDLENGGFSAMIGRALGATN